MHALEVTQKIQTDIALIAEKLKTGTSSIFDRVSNLINEKKEFIKIISSFVIKHSIPIEGIMTSSKINISDNMLESDFLLVI